MPHQAVNLYSSAWITLQYFKKGEIVIRAFLAIRLNEEIKAAIAHAIDYLKSAGARGSWINPREAHITLAFFEDISEKEIGSLTNGLRVALLRISLNIEFSLGKLGCFPDAKRPRVLWVDIETVNLDLNRLKELLDKEIKICTDQKIDKRLFKPHLTLARFKESCNLDLPKWSQKITFGDLSPKRMKCVTFFKSELTSKGAKHSVIADILF